MKEYSFDKSLQNGASFSRYFCSAAKNWLSNNYTKDYKSSLNGALLGYVTYVRPRLPINLPPSSILLMNFGCILFTRNDLWHSQLKSINFSQKAKPEKELWTSCTKQIGSIWRSSSKMLEEQNLPVVLSHVLISVPSGRIELVLSSLPSGYLSQ